MGKYIWLAFTVLSFCMCKEEVKGPINKWSIKELSESKSFKPEKPVNEVNVDFMNEASGIAASRLNNGYYYSINDSGSPAEVYMIDSLGHYCGKISLEGLENRDWEDIATGPGPDSTKTYIYVGESGDNRTKHNHYFIYRFEETINLKDLSKPFSIKENADKIRFHYPEGKSYNCEALLLDPSSRDIYLPTKGDYSTVFKLSYPQSTSEEMTAESIVTLPIKKVTAGDISFDGKEILIKNYERIFYWNKGILSTDETLSKIKPTIVPYLKEPQGEGIAWSLDGQAFYTLSELESAGTQYFIRYNKVSGNRK